VNDKLKDNLSKRFSIFYPCHDVMPPSSDTIPDI